MSALTWQANTRRTWTDVPPDDCTCAWINYSDYGGWYLIARRHDCPAHPQAPRRMSAPGKQEGIGA